MVKSNRLFGHFELYSLFTVVGLTSGFLSQAILVWTSSRTPIVAITVGFLALALMLKLSSGVKKDQAYSAVLIIPFVMWLALGLIWTPSGNYAYEKFAAYLICAMLFLAPIFNIDFPLKKFLKHFFYIAISIFAFAVIGMLKNATNFYGITDAQRAIYLTAGYYGGALLVLIGCAKLFENSIIELILVIALIFGVLLTGARGPLIFALPIMMVGFMMRRRYMPIIFLTSSVVLIGLVLQVIAHFEQVSFFVDRAVQRFSLLFGGELSSRTNLWILMRDWLSDNNAIYYGYGVGAWGIKTTGFDGRAYPHNMFLEILFEHGVVGLVLISFVVFFSLIKALKVKNELAWAFGALFIYESLNLMKSFTFSDARLFFFLMGVFLILGVQLSGKKNTEH